MRADDMGNLVESRDTRRSQVRVLSTAYNKEK